MTRDEEEEEGEAGNFNRRREEKGKRLVNLREGNSGFEVQMDE